MEIYQISLIAAYLAGMVALFAPCCISYLLPAYLGNVFRERKAVIGMTIIYSLGIFVVMLPIVLGAKVLANTFVNLHDQTYIVGGGVMLVVATLSFIGIKLPMPHFSVNQKGGRPDVISTFTLGLISGITSACCAPVLIGVITLSSLSTSTIGALSVGAAYVLGMVSPLYLASVFIHQKNLLTKPILKKVLGTVKLGGRDYPIFVSNLVATAIFTLTGFLLIGLALTGKLGMPTEQSAVTKFIMTTALTITQITDYLPGSDIIFVTIVSIGVYKLIKRAKSQRHRDTPPNHHHQQNL